MPRYSEDTRLKKAIKYAIKRLAFINAYGSECFESDEAAAEINKIKRLSTKTLSDITTDEILTVYSTFVYAEQWMYGLTEVQVDQSKLYVQKLGRAFS